MAKEKMKSPQSWAKVAEVFLN